MTFPRPLNAQVIGYSYLWQREHLRGQDEGIKDRPCAVILVAGDDADGQTVTVLPITHTPPSATATVFAIEIPPATKKRLGLDSERSWVVISEANRFLWPGPDLRPMKSGQPETVLYGYLPRAFYQQVRQAFIDAYRQGMARMVTRQH